MARVFLVLAAASGFVAVAAGAFGAHALKTRLAPDLLAVFDTAVRYQMFHVVGLVVAAWLLARGATAAALVSGWCFAAGTLIFSGSLYALALTGARWLGAITPVGGALFLAGWLLLAWAAWRGV
jgi:uncharacterized membrane protein YgdD (TMEM256/DUF423 family)